MWTKVDTQNDILSRVLERVKLDAFVTCAFDVGGRSSIVFPTSDALRFKVILRGECWLTVEGDETTYHLRAGDCFLISGGRTFALATHRADTRMALAEELIHTRNDAGVIVHAGGGDILSIGAVFQFQGHFSQLILRALPPVIHLSTDLEQASILRWSLERFGAEFRGTNAGRSLMMGYLAPIILLQTLRVHTSLPTSQQSWLMALSHPKLSKAIEAVHADCRCAWSVASLAALACMSRSGFALNFKLYVGITPLEYVVQWRMQIACHLLEQRELSLAAIADHIGYRSESAFSAAFKKLLGIRPGQYVKRWRMQHER